MNIGNLAQTAVQSFMSMGNMATQGMKMIQSPMMQQMGNIANSFAGGAAGGFAFGAAFGAGVGGANGFLSPPQQSNVGFGQMPGMLGGMNNMWNSLGNTMAKGLMGGLAKMTGAMTKMFQGLSDMMGKIGNMMNQLMPMMNMGKQVQNAMAQLPGMAGAGGAGGAAGAGAAGGMAGAGGAQGNYDMKTANFPKLAGSGFLDGLKGKSANQVAKSLNVSGRSDVKKINSATKMLGTAAPSITTGKQTGKGKLNLSQAQVDAIKNAPDLASAKKAVLKAIGEQTGVKGLEGLNMGNKNGIRSSKARNAVNKLLGTKVRNGREKNSGSSLVLDTMAENIAKSMRKGSFGQTQVQSPGQTVFGGFAFGGAAGGAAAGGAAQGGMAQMATGMPGGEGGPALHNCWGGMDGGAAAGGAAFGGFGFGMWQVPGQTTNIPNPSTDVTVDLGAFTGATNKVGELASPLIFDLEGTGLELKQGGLVEVDIDGDGNTELVTDINADNGLLIFDSKTAEVEGLTGADMFGDNTDLSAYGIDAPTEDGRFKDGFQALRSLCEHYKLVNDSKQFLDVGDLGFLEEEVGLRMRVGGIEDGDDRRFADIGVTEINLGNPAQTQHLEDAPEDRWGNKIIHQDGATFTVYTEVRKYADIWFKIQARLGDAPDQNQDLKAIKGVDLLNKGRR